LPAGPIAAPLKCSPNGEIFFRSSEEGSNVFVKPVVKVSRDGKRITKFSLGPATGLQEGAILDFSPGYHGELHVLAMDGKGSFYVLGYDNDGTFLSKKELPNWIYPRQIAVFGNGQFLIAGKQLPEGEKNHLRGKPFTGIFDARGQFISKVSLPDDIRPQSDQSGEASPAPRVDRDIERAISLSAAENSNDGKVFLMRYAADAPVFALVPGGFVKAIPAKAPEGAYLSTIKADGRNLVLMYIKKVVPGRAQIAEVIFHVIDVETGEKLQEFFHSSPELGSAFVCYNSGVFTFLRSTDDGKHLQFVHATP
jgi:hypothetical protein